mgnify:CR=1 FL=1
MSGIENEYESALAQFIEIGNKDFPTVFIVDTSNIDDIKKFKISGKINEKNLNQLLESWLGNNLTPLIKSEEIPKENN